MARLTIRSTDRLQSIFGDLDGRIHWLGRIKNEELPAYISQAKLFVLCSFSEGASRSLVEAMACGVPCIGTNVHGTKTCCSMKSPAISATPTPTASAKLSETVLAQPDLMRKMGDNARKYALENYSFTKIMQRKYDLLHDIARRHPVDSAPRRIANYLFRRR